MEGYTIPEVAERLGVPAQQIREWIEKGRLDAVRVRGRWRVPEDGLQSPSDEPAGADERSELEVAELRTRLAQLESRLDQLEREDPIEGRATMRPALAPLFREGTPPNGGRD
ncbi:MAG: helix-turn-helix domain-containing protein [Thermoleophilaceae bacterium]